MTSVKGLPKMEVCCHSHVGCLQGISYYGKVFDEVVSTFPYNGKDADDTVLHKLSSVFLEFSLSLRSLRL